MAAVGAVAGAGAEVVDSIAVADVGHAVAVPAFAAAGKSVGDVYSIAECDNRSVAVVDENVGVGDGDGNEPAAAVVVVVADAVVAAAAVADELYNAVHYRLLIFSKNR